MDKDSIIRELREELRIKDNIIRELREELQKDINKFEDYILTLKSKEELINNLNTSLKLKDDQIKTMIDSMNLKEQHIDTLNKSLEIKNQNIKALETSVSLKGEELKELSSSTVKKDVLEDKDEEIEDYQKKLTILTGELEKADEDLEALEAENEKLRNNLASESDEKIIDSTFRVIPKEDILKKIRAILRKAVHNVTIAVLDINDLQDLHLYEVRSSVNVKIMCNIDPSLEEDADLLEELESLDNITIRLYEDRDRYLIDRDGEELLFSIVGEDENNNLVIYTKDAEHQRLLRSLVMEGWLRARKLD
jgi:DNA repair exonuclease SbcCD ATPase subunit